MIEGQGLTKIFNDFWGRPKVTALRGVDLLVPEGSVFGLLGPNGAGKSTLIKIVLGHLYATSGVIRVLGRSPRDVSVKQRIGYVPERMAFYQNLTAVETLKFFANLLGLTASQARTRIEQLLNMLGLQQAADRMVGEFSHGMRKRLGLAQCLLNDPDLLLLDEPTAGLDPIGCREIKDLILTLGRRGRTILMTSHLLADVQDVCDTIMILYGGRVQASGPVDGLLAKKDEIQIRAGRVPETTIARVRAIFEEDSRGGPFEVVVPTRTLEDFFLFVVAEANNRREETAGAAMGSGVADYLRETDDGTTLAALTRSPANAEKTDAAADAGIDQDALQRLTAAAPVAPERSEVDRETLSSLTRKP